MPSTNLTFSDRAAHRAWLASQAALPKGFRVGATRFEFVPVEVHKPAKMTITVLALDKPSDSFAALFTRNAFPGAPIHVGRSRLQQPTLGAIVVNNKISNVCAPGGVETAERVCTAAAAQLGLSPMQILPSSTGVIGWRLPEQAIIGALPQAVAALQSASILPAAEGIVTTDLYPKIRRADLSGGASIVGIAKGAGMIEPNLATMLVYLLTDADISRDDLRAALRDAVNVSFNRMSIDSDTSTSDTVAALSSRRTPCDLAAFRAALTQVCSDLSEDVVRNGEGVHHVMRVQVRNAPDVALAQSVGKSIVNSPLFQCAVCGNDPNVGRLVCAIGKHIGAVREGLDLSRTRLSMGGVELFSDGAFRLDPEKERRLIEHLKAAELYESRIPADGVYTPPIDFPPHERCVEIDVDLGAGPASATIFGSDRSHEYISENADYRS